MRAFTALPSHSDTRRCAIDLVEYCRHQDDRRERRHVGTARAEDAADAGHDLTPEDVEIELAVDRATQRQWWDFLPADDEWGW